mgnify:CR=1 FL=1
MDSFSPKIEFLLLLGKIGESDIIKERKVKSLIKTQMSLFEDY